MRRFRRETIEPRLELYPMIDVIFLLLTFFVYSMAMMIRADILPVKLTGLSSSPGKAAQAESDIVAITVDKAGELFLDRRPVTLEALDVQMREWSKRPHAPTVYLALEAESSTDRGPLLLKMIEHVRAAGIQNFVLVGQPSNASGAANSGATPKR